jgi:hypothetical protein
VEYSKLPGTKPGKLSSISIIIKNQYNYNRNSICYIFSSEITKYIILYIYSYRFQRAILINTLQDINVTNDFMIYRRIVCAVDIHRQATELVFIQCRTDIYEVIIKGYFSFPWNYLSQKHVIL